MDATFGASEREELARELPRAAAEVNHGTAAVARSATASLAYFSLDRSQRLGGVPWSSGGWGTGQTTMTAGVVIKATQVQALR